MPTAKTQREIITPPTLEIRHPSALVRLLGIACTQHLALVIAVCAAIKYVMALCFPFIGDEAYVAMWGKYPAWGYYDHPPMLGWLIHLLMDISSSPSFLRLMPIVFSVLVAAGIYIALRQYDKNKACLASALFMVCPFSMVFVFVTPDVPLMLFSFLSAFFLFKAENSRLYRYYPLSGVFLGLAFLSKYFAVLLALSYLVYFLAVRTNAGKIKGFILLALGAAPFIAQNLAWNYAVGWPNIMHNWFNRLAASHSNSVTNLLILLGISAYAFTPPVLYFAFKNRKRIITAFEPAQFRLFALAWLIPLCLLVLISFIKTVSPHWLLFLVPFACIVTVLTLDTKQLLETIHFAAVFSVIQAFFFCVIPLLPVATVKHFVTDKSLATLTLHLHPDKVVSALRQYSDGFTLATQSFSTSALLEYDSGKRVIVIGKGTNHGRQDDMLTDFKRLNGADILILEREAPDLEKFQDCFETITTRQFDVGAARFYVMLGHGFKYQPYRDRFLDRVARRYYQIPAWLPLSKNFFKAKYDL
jgi:hypothetical protein